MRGQEMAGRIVRMVREARGASKMSELQSYEVEAIVRGYHVYGAVWEAPVGQILPCQQEGGNIHNPYAVAVVEGGVTVGHVPRAISSVCYLFLGRNGTLRCQVTGTRHYSVDLPQGGLEIPCKLIFSGHARLIAKVQKLLQEAITSGLLTSCNDDSVLQQESKPEQPEKKRRIEQDNVSHESWLELDGIVLSQFDKKQLQDGSWLNDKHINYAQSLLKKQFPHIDGWKLTLLAQKEQEKIKHGVQIIHCRGNHWIVASTLGCSSGEAVKVFDSLYTSVDKDTQDVILNLFQTDGKPMLEMAKMHRQKGGNDCGLFAIAVATALAFGSNLVEFKQSGMREHLLKCFEDGVMTPFCSA